LSIHICFYNFVVNAIWLTSFFTKKIKEWVSDCFLKPNEQYFSYIMVRTCYNQWDDDHVMYIPADKDWLAQNQNEVSEWSNVYIPGIYTLLHSDTSFWFRANQSLSAGIYTLLHSDTSFWFWVNRSLFLLFNAAYLAEKQQIQIS
jgi:hypothetical protein